MGACAIRQACLAVSEAWDAAGAAFLDGGPAVLEALRDWSTSYRGSDCGEVTFDALPEPFLGPLHGTPAAVFLALNPGRADLEFHGRAGVFATEIEAAGGYTRWAATWPYLRDPWVLLKGRNRHHTTRLKFAQNWTGDPTITGEDMVGFELFPWHSAAVTSTMRPDPQIIREWVLDPVRELGAPVFAFGKPWFDLLEHQLRLPVADRLGARGRPYSTAVASRSVVVFQDDDGLTIIAESHSGSAGPPSATETLILRSEVDRWVT